ncbi:AAA family ATPase [Wolbachia endosymbiont of Pentidionis agamae]|uniref:AAA family ATPase n=1 Tax=Wolbachia endosymbiont of Pentidionis agamae TaxID=3110435 RepID=UPI002FD261FE
MINYNEVKKKLIDNISIQTWLFCGKKGIGKATLAKSFAKWLLTNNSNSSPLDLFLAEEKVIGVETIRKMRDFLHLSSIYSQYKIAIIDSLEAMSKNSQNAILKILEEPPKNSKILIICHEPYNTPITIKCRCFNLYFYQSIQNGVKSSALTSKNEITNHDLENLYKCFSELLKKTSNFSQIKEIINSEVDLDLIFNLVQELILDTAKNSSKNNDVEILYQKWKDLNKLHLYAKHSHLDRKHVLNNIVNIITMPN